MIQSIKSEFLKDPDKLVDFFSEFGFERIRPTTKEIRMARDIDGGQNISVRLENNEYLCVNDWSKGIGGLDIFSYVTQEKRVTFREVLQTAKRILGLQADWKPKKKVSLFNGIYDRIIRPDEDVVLPELDEKTLEKYEKIPSQMFLRDGIGLHTQNEFNLRYDFESNRVVIPIYDELSRCVGTKGRLNDVPDEFNPKYLYLDRLPSGQVLYGYNVNYPYMYGGDVVLAEAEKTVLQAYDFGVRNVVGLGGNNVSKKQAKLIMQCQPKRVIIALDEGIEYEHIKKCADTIMEYCKLRDTEIWYWDASVDLDIDHKSSPTDLGKEKFEEIMQDELVRIY